MQSCLDILDYNIIIECSELFLNFSGDWHFLVSILVAVAFDFIVYPPNSWATNEIIDLGLCKLPGTRTSVSVILFQKGTEPNF